MSFTVPTESCQASFIWTGVQQNFVCGFPVIEATDLVVQYSSGQSGAFNGSIDGAVLTVTLMTSGQLGVGSVLSGNGAITGTKIVGLGSGLGGAGSYVVTPAQNLPAGAMTASPASATLTLGVHYAVYIDPLSGNATVGPLATSDKGPGVVTITRSTPALQGTQFSTLDDYPADAFTFGFDQAMMCIAELKRRVAALEGSAPPPALAIAPQRSIATAAQLPIQSTDQVLNFSAATDLAPLVPGFVTRAGVALTIKLLPGTAAQTLHATGAETFDGQPQLVAQPGQEITLRPYADGLNQGYAIA